MEKKKSKKEKERILFAERNKAYCMFCSKPLHSDDDFVSSATDIVHWACWLQSGRRPFWKEEDEKMERKELEKACAKLHRLIKVAGAHGGLWVSAAGGTANVAIGMISRHFNVPWEEVENALVATGGEEFYSEWYWAQPSFDNWDEFRWDIKTLVRAALK